MAPCGLRIASPLTCTRPRDLEDHPDLAMRIRGALGRTLKQLCDLPQARPDPFGRPDAFLTLYNTSKAGRPMQVAVDVKAGTLTVSVGLFGGAGFHLPRVEEALVLALSQGVALRHGGRMRAVFTPPGRQTGTPLRDRAAARLAPCHPDISDPGPYPHRQLTLCAACIDPLVGSDAHSRSRAMAARRP